MIVDVAYCLTDIPDMFQLTNFFDRVYEASNLSNCLDKTRIK